MTALQGMDLYCKELQQKYFELLTYLIKLFTLIWLLHNTKLRRITQPGIVIQKLAVIPKIILHYHYQAST